MQVKIGTYAQVEHRLVGRRFSDSSERTSVGDAPTGRSIPAERQADLDASYGAGRFAPDDRHRSDAAELHGFGDMAEPAGPACGGELAAVLRVSRTPESW